MNFSVRSRALKMRSHVRMRCRPLQVAILTAVLLQVKTLMSPPAPVTLIKGCSPGDEQYEYITGLP